MRVPRINQLHSVKTELRSVHLHTSHCFLPPTDLHRASIVPSLQSPRKCSFFFLSFTLQNKTLKENINAGFAICFAVLTRQHESTAMHTRLEFASQNKQQSIHFTQFVLHITASVSGSERRTLSWLYASPLLRPSCCVSATSR